MCHMLAVSRHFFCLGVVWLVLFCIGFVPAVPLVFNNFAKNKVIKNPI